MDSCFFFPRVSFTGYAIVLGQIAGVVICRVCDRTFGRFAIIYRVYKNTWWMVRIATCRVCSLTRCIPCKSKSSVVIYRVSENTWSRFRPSPFTGMRLDLSGSSAFNLQGMQKLPFTGYASVYGAGENTWSKWRPFAGQTTTRGKTRDRRHLQSMQLYLA